MYLLEFLMIFSQCLIVIILHINYIIKDSDILYFIKLLYTIIVSLELTENIFRVQARQGAMISTVRTVLIPEKSLCRQDRVPGIPLN